MYDFHKDFDASYQINEISKEAIQMFINRGYYITGFFIGKHMFIRIRAV